MSPSERTPAAAAPLAPWEDAGTVELALFAAALQRDPVRAFAWLGRRHGETVAFARARSGRGLGRPLVVTTDPQLLRHVLYDPRFRNSSLTLSGPRGSSHRRLRKSLFRMHGEEHRRNRRLILPAMQKKAIEPLCDAMVDVAERVLARYAVGQTRDVATDMKDVARQISAAALFGIADLDEAERLGRRVEDWLADSYRLGPRVLPYDLPGSPYRAMLRKAEALERVALELFERKRAEGYAGSDLLTHLVRELDHGDALTLEELLGHLHIFFLAAHETTSYALAWTVMLLAQHPDVLETVAGEVHDVLGDARPTPALLERLGALDAAIDESLRMFPIVPFGARIATEALEIEGRPVPRKTRILIPFVSLHHDAARFAQPRRFDPQRFRSAQAATGALPPFSYLPFSAGLHMCVGVPFARQSMSVALACLLQRFSVQLVDGARIDRRTSVTMAPHPGVPVEVLARGTRPRRARMRGNALDLVDLG